MDGLPVSVGIIPEELGALTKLKRFSLASNQLTGKRRVLHVYFSNPRGCLLLALHRASIRPLHGIRSMEIILGVIRTVFLSERLVNL